MQEFFSRIGYYLTHPQAIIYAVATMLLYPVLFAEVIALVVALFQAGQFTAEWFRRRKYRKRLDVRALGESAAKLSSEGGPGAAVGVMDAFSASALGATMRDDLGASATLTRTQLLKALADAELVATRRLQPTRLLIRIGPMLGLMGTLIPISPALVALARGDVATLSRNLVIAFSTTVVGLLIGGIGYVITTVRDRWYQQDIVDAEYVLDHLGV
jgi:biopolymer transport protein ExbB/TolQ